MHNSVKTAGQAIRVGSKLLGVAPKYWAPGQFEKLQDSSFTLPDKSTQISFIGCSTTVDPNIPYPTLLKNLLTQTGIRSLHLANHWYSRSSIVVEPIYGPKYNWYTTTRRDKIGERETCPHHRPIVSAVASDFLANITSNESLAIALSACQDNKDSHVVIRYAFNSDGTYEYSRLSVMLSRLLKATSEQVSLVDTLGLATPGSVKSLVEKVRNEFSGEMSRIAFGFYDNKGMAPFNFLSAVECGIENHLIALDSSSALRLFDARKAGLLCSALEIPTTLNYAGVCSTFAELTSEAERQQGKNR